MAGPIDPSKAVKQLRQLTKTYIAQIFEAWKGFMPIDLDNKDETTINFENSAIVPVG